MGIINFDENALIAPVLSKPLSNISFENLKFEHYLLVVNLTLDV